jgi:hypothetical protein
METIELSLPDELANRATELGLLEPAALNNLLREEIHRRAADCCWPGRGSTPCCLHGYRHGGSSRGLS